MIGTIKKLPFPLTNFIIFVYLMAPLIVVIFTSFSKEAYPDFPPKTYSLRWYSEFFQNEQFIGSLFLSSHVALWVMILALLIGIPASLALARYRFRGSTLLSSLSMSPILFPHVVIGIALLIFYAKVWALSLFCRLRPFSHAELL